MHTSCSSDVTPDSGMRGMFHSKRQRAALLSLVEDEHERAALEFVNVDRLQRVGRAILGPLEAAGTDVMAIRTTLDEADVTVARYLVVTEHATAPTTADEAESTLHEMRAVSAALAHAAGRLDEVIARHQGDVERLVKARAQASDERRAALATLDFTRRLLTDSIGNLGVPPGEVDDLLSYAADLEQSLGDPGGRDPQTDAEDLRDRARQRVDTWSASRDAFAPKRSSVETLRKVVASHLQDMPAALSLLRRMYPLDCSADLEETPALASGMLPSVDADIRLADALASRREFPAACEALQRARNALLEAQNLADSPGRRLQRLARLADDPSAAAEQGRAPLRDARRVVALRGGRAHPSWNRMLDLASEDVDAAQLRVQRSGPLGYAQLLAAVDRAVATAAEVTRAAREQR